MSVQEQTQKVIQANKDHQYALKVYTERLESELESVERLLSIAEQSDDELDVDAGGTIVIPNAVKATGPIPAEVSLESSFKDDAEKRNRYLRCTDVHPMRAVEIETLADAVYTENYRLHALELQQRGQQPFGPPPSHYENTAGINWERVATKVSNAASSSGFKRTARECEIKWLGSSHPKINQSAWTQAEISQVKDLVDGHKEGEVDWVDVASKLGTNRTPVDCLRHAITRRTHAWTPESDRRLIEAIQIYGTVSWLQVARMVSEDATATQCQSRYMRTLDPTISRLPWSNDEDERLRSAVGVYGTAWSEVCEFIPNRSSEQCRERWQEKLSPHLAKGRWSEEEDEALLAAVDKVGEGKWKEISRVIGNGRTDNMCRGRYHVLAKRKQREVPSDSPAPAEVQASEHPLQIRFHPSSQLSPPPANGAADTVRIVFDEGTTRVQQPGTSQQRDEATDNVAKARPKPRRKRATRTATSGTQETGEAPSSSTGPPTTPRSSQPTRRKAATNKSQANTEEPPAKKRRTNKREGKKTSVPEESSDLPTAQAHYDQVKDVIDTRQAAGTEDKQPDNTSGLQTSATTVPPEPNATEVAENAGINPPGGVAPDGQSNTTLSFRGRGRGRGRGGGRSVAENTSIPVPARKSARLAGKTAGD
ncbi:unnamed protein product [Somion occarium]|uniref:Uncharacterized protein n=1 Tax=Somion occarium TaxID=3059160 RepID=A0ABP1D3X0_9APHY